MSNMTRQHIIGLIIASIIYAIPIVWLIIRDITIPVENIELILLLILASATVFYAFRTSDIAKATREQAEASVKMAEEMRDQSYTMIKPLVNIEFVEDAAELQASDEELEKGGITCYLKNVGIGPAIDTYSYIQGNTDKYKFNILESGVKTGNKKFALNKITGKLRLEVYYNDLHGRRYKSWREFRHVTEPLGIDISPLSSEIIEVNND